MKNLCELLEDNPNVEIATAEKDPSQAKKLPRDEVLKKAKIKAHQEELLQTLRELDIHERFEWIHYKYLKGIKLYEKEDYQKASEILLDALTAVNFKNEGSVNSSLTSGRMEKTLNKELYSASEFGNSKMSTKIEEICCLIEYL